MLNLFLTINRKVSAPPPALLLRAPAPPSAVVPRAPSVTISALTRPLPPSETAYCGQLHTSEAKPSSAWSRRKPKKGASEGRLWQSPPIFLFLYPIESTKTGIPPARLNDVPQRKTKKGIKFDSLDFCDSYRIQTCNLLIRSQMLYSVELRSQIF